ncbi:MAG: CapA family protein [Clostridia bacterium]|nr:CapA family protein [Clostridia bacterium]
MKKAGRKISFGTYAMLMMTALVLLGSALVFLRLSSGASVDLSRLKPEKLDLEERYEGPKEQALPAGEENAPIPAGTAAADIPREDETVRTFTLTAGGIAALEGEIRKNSYVSDVKMYDYSDIMMMLKKELQADLNVLFLENILSDDGKSTDTVAPAAAADMLKAAGFNLAACGHARIYSLESAGIQSTRNALTERGITPLGIPETRNIPVTEVRGCRVAVLQYTGTISASTRKTMAKREESDLVPEADAGRIAADIQSAREQGAQAVIILMHWGKSGRAVDKGQRELAQQIANAGADVIIGCGSRTVQGMERLTAADSGKEVPCFWSLGTLLSGNRNNAKALAGMLVHITFRVGGGGETALQSISYTPMYTWKYKQDGRYYYRCLACAQTPDGMDAEQQRLKEKAATVVREAMKDSGLEERTGE